MTAEHRQALDERRELMEARATALVERAIQDREPWVATVNPPQCTLAAPAWRDQIRIVAAYRDRYDITGAHPLGPVSESITQRADRAHAAAALRRAQGWPATPSIAVQRGSSRPSSLADEFHRCLPSVVVHSRQRLLLRHAPPALPRRDDISSSEGNNSMILMLSVRLAATAHAYLDAYAPTNIPSAHCAIPAVNCAPSRSQGC